MFNLSEREISNAKDGAKMKSLIHGGECFYDDFLCNLGIDFNNCRSYSLKRLSSEVRFGMDHCKSSAIKNKASKTRRVL